MTVHTTILSLGQQLNYYDSSLQGLYHGITLRWIEACLLDQEEIFDTRIQKITSDADLIGKIIATREKVRKHAELSPEDLAVLDILAFYESIILYHSPSSQHELFDATYSQSNFDEISTIAASNEIRKRGGLATIYSESGIYTIDEISSYLDELGKTIQQSMASPDEKAGIILGNINHATGLIYQAQTGWQFWDINQYPNYSPEFKGSTQDIANKISEDFGRQGHNNPYFAFNTSVIVIKNHSNLQQMTDYLQTFKNTHLITPQIALREEISDMGTINLVRIAAQYGQGNMIIPLKNSGADLNKANNDGFTPASIAAQKGHAPVITTLKNCGADLNKTDNSNQTPAFKAALCGYTDVIAALMKCKANMDIPYITSTEILRMEVMF